ncbi:MAG: hypothetical protein ACLSA6_18440 [Holdemania massiliensis]
MIVEIHEILIQKEKLSYPCDQLTVGFISEAEFEAFVKQADLSLPMPKQTETLMRNAVSVNEEAFWCVLHLINPGRANAIRSVC